MTPVGSTYVLDQMVNVKRAWDPTQAGTTLAIPRGVRNLKIQFRDPSAPWARDVSMRRALAYATDRQSFVDTLEYGLTTPAYTWVTTDDPVYAMLQQRGLATYAYDPTQASRLLADAGWTKGADGLFQKNGQHFHVDVSIQNRASFPQEATALAGQWSQFGFESAPALIPGNASNRDELTSTFQGVISWPVSFRDQAVLNWTTEQISTADTRWRGSNFGAYSNPSLDQLYDRFQTALEPAQQQSVLADAMKLANDDLPSIPFYTYVASAMFRKGVTGPGKVSPSQLASAWNIHTWTISQ
jgi:peptide/nickel transport system substrate-binding protein